MLSYIPLLTGATFENIVRLQLKGHDHAVKTTQLRRRYQHSAADTINQIYSHTYEHQHIRVHVHILLIFYLTLFL